SAGVVSMVAVAPPFRRRGIGSALLRRGEEYLRAAGARTLTAGNVAWHNPFYFGLYGGSDSSGFLASDAPAAPFLARHGYRPVHAYAVLHRRLPGPPAPADPRQPGLRRR